jgi:hypothetical protein
VIVQPIIDCATGGAKLTNEKAKEILPSIFERIKCVGLSEINRAGRCDNKPAEVDHIMANEVKPDNTPENGRPLCTLCHQVKSARDAVNAKKGRAARRETKKSQAKDAMRGKHFPKGAKQNSPYRKKMDGTVVWRETGEPVK